MNTITKFLGILLTTLVALAGMTGTAFAGTPAGYSDPPGGIALNGHWTAFSMKVHANTTVTALTKVYGCGGELVESFSDTGSGDFYHDDGGAIENGGYKRLGQNVTLTTTVSAPGYDTTTVTVVVNAQGVHDYCGSTPPPTKPLVSKWSTKLAKSTKLRHRVSVTATVATGAHVRYTWKVGHKTVKSGPGRKLFIKRGYRGKRIVLHVYVTKGAKHASHAYGFGRAHR